MVTDVKTGGPPMEVELLSSRCLGYEEKSWSDIGVIGCRLV